MIISEQLKWLTFVFNFIGIVLTHLFTCTTVNKAVCAVCNLTSALVRVRVWRHKRIVNNLMYYGEKVRSTTRHNQKCGPKFVKRSSRIEKRMEFVIVIMLGSHRVARVMAERATTKKEAMTYPRYMGIRFKARCRGGNWLARRCKINRPIENWGWAHAERALPYEFIQARTWQTKVTAFNGSPHLDRHTQPRATHAMCKPILPIELMPRSNCLPPRTLLSYSLSKIRSYVSGASIPIVHNLLNHSAGSEFDFHARTIGLIWNSSANYSYAF